MKPIKPFDEFIKEGIVRKQSLDRSRAEFLKMESEQNYNYLLDLIEKMGIIEVNANDYIKKCYDILMELIRAKMLILGLNATGHNAHEAEVSYMRLLGFSENEVQFVNQMRYFRNGMLYYGTIMDKEYAEKVIDFTKKNYKKLRQD